VPLSKNEKQAIVAETMGNFLSTKKGRDDFATSLMQPIRRSLNYSGLGRRILNSHNSWLCGTCWTSGIKKNGPLPSNCQTCGKPVEWQDVAEFVLWTYDDEIIC
jgi:hypothetical protein